jgi:hypothetical protein
MTLRVIAPSIMSRHSGLRLASSLTISLKVIALESVVPSIPYCMRVL